MMRMTNVLAIVLAALIQVESGGNPSAVGDGGRAVGILQQHPISVREANRITGNRWTYADRRDPARAKAMCLATLAWHYKRGVTDPVELGGRWRNPKGDAPRWYKERVREAINRTKGSPSCLRPRRRDGRAKGFSL